MISHFFPFGALVLSVLTQSIYGLPNSLPVSSSRLVKRANKLVGCDEEQTKKVGQALADMTSLATLAYDKASETDLGFTHYFKNDELEIFKTAMSTIASNNDPTNAPYQFLVNCKPTDDAKKECDDHDSYAWTDGTVVKDDNDAKSVYLCDKFWNGPDTENDLPPGGDSDDEKKKLKDFCAKDKYWEYVTAGHVLLHEVTHLDAVAKKFPLDPNDKGEHGTIDYNIGSKPIQDARRLKIRIDNGQNDLQAPAYTAESYAGAATELWFEKMCEKEFLNPKTGYE